jgi:hypothetical protein
MSHPDGISGVCSRRISRMRRLMRLRTTAPPSAFFTLIPKRLRPASFGRKKTTNCALERLWPLRYTASNSMRRTSRASRGKRRLPFCPAPDASDGRKAMASLLSPRGQHAASSYCLHTRAEAVCLMAPSHAWLKSALGQSSLPSVSRKSSKSRGIV